MAEDGRHRELQQLAGPQWTVLRVEQITAAGFTRHQLNALSDRGILHRRYKGIYTYGTDRPPWKGVLLAAQWSCGEDAYLTGRTALALADVCRLYLRRIEVAVPRRTVRARQPPIQLQRTSVPPERLRKDGPLRSAPVPRALLDLAAQGATVEELKRLITEAMERRRLSHPEMRELIQRHAGHPGITVLTEAYAKYLPRPKAKSGLERSFDAGLSTRPYIPEPSRNIYIAAGGREWEIDRYWADQQVAVELQSRYHDPHEVREKDEFKAAKLALLGIQIIYFSEDRWDLEPEDCLDDLEALLALRGWRQAA
jgi:hypothetical protein